MNSQPVEWVPLGELCRITRGASPRPIIDWIRKEGTPWVKISDATQEPGRFITKTKEFIRDEGREKSVVVQPGDLIVSNSATPGIPKFMKIEACVHDGWLLLRDFDRVTPRYLYYVILGDREKLVGKGSGSVFTNLKTEILKSHQIPLPSISHQVAVEEILWNLDDFIEKKNALAGTLESIAQALFRSWFVDFDPVRAKMAGEKPVGMDDATAVLFPDSMEESELGEIPAGWEITTIGEVLHRVATKGLPKSTTLSGEGTALVLTQGDNVVAGFADVQPEVQCSGRDPHFIFGDHTCRMHLSTVPFSVLPNTLVLRARAIDCYWAYHATLGRQNFESYRRHWSELSQKAVIVPDANLASAFGRVVRPLYELRDRLVLERFDLQILRDSLLPRLISGELQVPENLVA